jgi:uncharacterized repeat protein (TIGR01451 family)
MKRSFTLLLALFICTGFSSLFAQKEDYLDKALRHLEQQASEWQLQTADIMDVVVSDQYVSRHNGVTHFYFVQRYAGIPIYNAINGIHLDRNGKVFYATNTFQANLAERVNATRPQISAPSAVAAAFALYDIQETPSLKKSFANNYTYFGGNATHNDFEVKLRYFPVEETGEIRLCWDMALDLRKSADYWSVRIDALTGDLVHQHNFTVYCNFDHGSHQTTHADDCAHQWEVPPTKMQPVSTALLGGGGATYNVFPVPVESPIHGERQLVVDPADPIASPYGWHDINGEAGAEYTITRGNNTHAYLDNNATNSSSGDEPDGGEELVFDYYFDVNDEPENMQDAAVTQLFYMVNMMHDITYAYGFNEEAGNFQKTNYNGGVGANDHVLAEAQDGSGTNNANFSTPQDGVNGRMQMFLWGGVAGRVLNINEPAVIAGSYDSGTASYGPPVPAIPIVGEVVRAYDESAAPFLGCEELANADEVNGKIALIDRGSCFFEEKTFNAQAAGAIAVIICNYLNSSIGMAGGVEGTDPDIVTISLGSSDCNLIKNILENGETVTVSIGLPDNSGPTNVGSSMDNGVIAHEYGHGISNRLTGGPTASGCLSNLEQMGEGWSDFFALITSVRPGDTGATPRGIGNYSDRKAADGTGIRRLPYSTDLAINDQDIDDIIFDGIIDPNNPPAPHPVGEVWTTAIWDLYWAMVDEYGYDTDLINGTGGNNMAIQLVMDGMKYQSCDPGFEDARDALFTADFINYDGIHECLIWEAFARRGMGIDSDQGSRNNRNDNTPNFEVLPTCIKELKISKTANKDLVVAGETIRFTLKVFNHKEEAVSGVMVEDELPNGLSYISGSATGASVENNGSNLTFDIGDMNAGDEITITYEVNTDPANRSIQVFLDDMESGDDNWFFENNTGFDIWDLSNTFPNSGNTSWFVPNVNETNDQFLIFAEDIEVIGTSPAVKFDHFYETQVGFDGGFVQISRDGGSSWEDITHPFIRNGYRGELSAITLFAPGIQAFWGASDGYIDSYIDLSPYQGETINLRFRFASDGAASATGWFMDDFEIMDKVAYEGEACVSSLEGDLNCDTVDNGGVIVKSEFGVSTEDIIHDPSLLTVYPNPANNVLNVAVNKDLNSNMDIQLISASGQLIRQWTNQSLQGQMIPLNISDIPAGFYFLQVNTKEGIYSEKVTIQ